MGDRIKVAGVQMDVAFNDAAANLRRIADSFAQTSLNGASLTVFPECAVTGYCFESLEEARSAGTTIPGPVTDELASMCAEYDAYLVSGLLEASGDRLFNACVLVGPGGVVGAYRKVHLPYLGVDRFTTPGDREFEVHEAGGLRVGMTICYDAAFPEAARVLALKGADLIVLPTNWPPGAECTADCIVNARALENHVYYLAVNRVGTERGFEFIGRSKLAHPSGSLETCADESSEQIIYGDLDVELVRNKHIIRVPGKHEIDRFKDRRPEMYGPIVQAKD